jgi:peptidoglycan hydrolase CwlO-like protein
VEALKDMNLTLQQQKAMIQQKDRKLANMENRLTELDKMVGTLTNQVHELMQKSQSH